MSMKCPFCAGATHVTDSRPSEPKGSTRRRYRCISKDCKMRWSTIEIMIFDSSSKDMNGVRGIKLWDSFLKQVPAANRKFLEELRSLVSIDGY